MTLEEQINITEKQADFHKTKWLRKSVYQDKPLQSGKWNRTPNIAKSDGNSRSLPDIGMNYFRMRN